MPRWSGLRDDGGAVGIMAAVGGALACVVAGVAIDAASIAYEARRYQGAADLAALAAASRMDQAHTAAETTARANVATIETIVSHTGVYDPDPTRAADDRFTATPQAGVPHNAARVTVSGHATLYFGRLVLGRERAAITRTGMAALPHREPAVAFSLGSRLARLDGGLANQVLGALTGSQVNLSLMDYEALADVDVNLLSFVDALAVDADITAGDYDGLLESEVKAGRALKIIEDLTDGADSGLNKLGRAADDLNIRVGDLVGTDIQTTDGLRGGLDATVSALDLASAIIETGGGDRQARLETGARAGLADLDVWLAIGERPNNSPWVSVTRDGLPVIRTAQARLYIEARTTQTLAGMVQVRLPVIVEIASAEAKLSSLRCTGSPRAIIEARTGVTRARTTLASVPALLSITGSADIEAAGSAPQLVTFDAADIAARRTRTITSTGFTSGTVTSLLGRLDLRVNVLGLGLGLGDLAGKLGQLLTPLGPVLDGVVDGLLGALGLGVGQADITVQGVTCDAAGGPPRLVG
jgi:uncharacterized membrane protein